VKSDVLFRSIEGARRKRSRQENDKYYNSCEPMSLHGFCKNPFIYPSV
jgi:hypothetical protein